MKTQIIFFTLFIFNAINSSRVLTKGENQKPNPKPSNCLDQSKFEDFAQKTYKKKWEDIQTNGEEKETGLFFYKDFDLVSIELKYSENSKTAEAEHIY